MWVGKNNLCAGGMLSATIEYNGLRLKEVGDFYNKCLYEEQMFVEPQNCHTKH